MMKHPCSRLGIRAFGLALGITWALAAMILSWVSWKFHCGTPLVTLLASLYKGYASTPIGGLWGGLWGFIDGAIMGVVTASLYNLCIRCCNRVQEE